MSVPKEEMDKLKREMGELRTRLADIEEEVSQYSRLYLSKNFDGLVLFEYKLAIEMVIFALRN